MRIGTDIIEVKRIKNAIKNKEFLNRILNQKEIEYVLKYKNSVSHIAGFFCVKEATMKALKDCKKISFKDIEVMHNESGSPYVQLYGEAKRVYETLNAKDIQISISQTSNYATAVCVIDEN